MKKIFAFLLALVLLSSLIACNADSDETTTPINESQDTEPLQTEPQSDETASDTEIEEVKAALDIEKIKAAWLFCADCLF